MAPNIRLTTRHVATMSLIVRHAGRPDIRVRMILFPEDDWVALYHVAHKMLHRARRMDPDFRIDEVHWRVQPHAI